MPSKTSMPLTLTRTLTLCLTLSGAAAAHSDNPFGLQPLAEGYMVADASEAASSRGASKSSKTDPAVATRPEAENTGVQKRKSKNLDAKCGEVKCGASGAR